MMWSLLLLSNTTESYPHTAERVRQHRTWTDSLLLAVSTLARASENTLSSLCSIIWKNQQDRGSSPAPTNCRTKAQNHHELTSNCRLFSDEDTLTCSQLEAAGWVGPPWRHWDGQGRYHGEVLPQICDQLIPTIWLQGIQNDRGRVNGVTPGHMVSHCHVGRTKDRLHLRVKKRSSKLWRPTVTLLAFARLLKQFLDLNYGRISSEFMQLIIIGICSIPQGHKHIYSENRLRVNNATIKTHWNKKNTDNCNGFTGGAPNVMNWSTPFAG